MTDRENMFYLDPNYAPIEMIPGVDYDSVKERFNDPMSYIEEYKKKFIHPIFTHDLLINIPMYLYNSNMHYQLLELALNTHSLNQVIEEDREYISSISTQMVCDYLNIPKLWTYNEEGKQKYKAFRTHPYEVGKIVEKLCLPSDLTDGRFESALGRSLKENMLIAQWFGENDFDFEVWVLQMMLNYQMNIDIFQTEDVQDLFVKKLRSIRERKLQAISGYEGKQASVINMAKLILGKDINKVRDILVDQLPFLIIYPKCIWSLLDIDEVISYKKAKDIYRFDFTKKEYDEAKRNVKEAIRNARNLKRNGLVSLNSSNINIENNFREFMNK